MEVKTTKCSFTMHRLSAFSVILIMIFSFDSFSQVNTEWIARYVNLDSSIIMNSIKTDRLNNVILAGYRGNGADKDCMILKYNPGGTLLWTRLFNGPGNGGDEIYDMTIDSLNNIYVTGVSHTDNNTFSDFFAAKYNSAGALLWSSRTGTTYTDQANSIGIDNLGNVYVAGIIYNEKWDLVTAKFSPSGSHLWSVQYTYTDSSREYKPRLIMGSDGTFSVTLECRRGTSNRTDDILTLKYNSAGVNLWTKIYNGPSDSADRPGGLAMDNLGNIYVAGFSTGNGTASNALLMKYDPAGNSQWVRVYNHTGTNNDGAFAVKISGSDVYTAGYTHNPSTNSNDGLVLKYNVNGALGWAVTYSGPENLDDEFQSLAVDNAGNVYAAGYTETAVNDADYLTVRYNSTGTQSWVKTYDGLGHSEDFILAGVVSDLSANIIVNGLSYSGTDYDLVTIKYSQTVAITQSSAQIPAEYSLSQNYPNPFNPSTTIHFDIAKTTDVKVKVYDMQGKEVLTLVSEILEAGKYEAVFDASAFPSGTYLYTLQAGEYSETKKMVLIK